MPPGSFRSLTQLVKGKRKGKEVKDKHEGDRRADNKTAAPAAAKPAETAIRKTAPQHTSAAANRIGGPASERNEHHPGDGAAAKEAEAALLDHIQKLEENHDQAQQANLKNFIPVIEKIYHLKAMQELVPKGSDLFKRELNDLERRKAFYVAKEKTYDENLMKGSDTYFEQQGHRTHSGERDRLKSLAKGKCEAYTITARTKRHEKLQDHMQRDDLLHFKKKIVELCKFHSVEPPTDWNNLFQSIAGVPHESHSSTSHLGHPSHSGSTYVAGKQSPEDRKKHVQLPIDSVVTGGMVEEYGRMTKIYCEKQEENHKELVSIAEDAFRINTTRRFFTHERKSEEEGEKLNKQLAEKREAKAICDAMAKNIDTEFQKAFEELDDRYKGTPEREENEKAWDQTREKYTKAQGKRRAEALDSHMRHRYHALEEEVFGRHHTPPDPFVIRFSNLYPPDSKEPALPNVTRKSSLTKKSKDAPLTRNHSQAGGHERS